MRFDDDNVNFTKIDGKINLKDFYRIIEINEEIFEMKREALRLGWFEISNWNFQKKIKLFVCI
jgi:hypothetical protein